MGDKQIISVPYVCVLHYDVISTTLFPSPLFIIPISQAASHTTLLVGPQFSHIADRHEGTH